jgi:hypothetical protein
MICHHVSMKPFLGGGGDLSFSLSYPTLSYCPMSCHHLSSMSTTCHNFFIMPTFCTCSVMPFQICRLSLFSSLHIDHLAPFTMKRLRGWKLKLRRGYIMISGLASLLLCMLATLQWAWTFRPLSLGLRPLDAAFMDPKLNEGDDLLAYNHNHCTLSRIIFLNKKVKVISFKWCKEPNILHIMK